MNTAYLFEKKELAFLCVLNNGAETRVPSGFTERVEKKDVEGLINNLERKGYIYRTENKLSMERTIAYLTYQLGTAYKGTISIDGKYWVYYCKDIILVLTKDEYSSKVKLIPIRDEDMLKEFSEENCFTTGKVQSFTEVSADERNDINNEYTCSGDSMSVDIS